MRTNLTGFGSAFAGRGTSLNDAIASLEPLFRGLEPVTRVPERPGHAAARASSRRSAAPPRSSPRSPSSRPTSSPRPRSRSRRSPPTPTALQETISETAPTLQTGVDLLPRERPFLADYRRLGRGLRPGVNRPASDPADAQRRDRRRHAGASQLDRPPTGGCATCCAPSTGSSPSPRRGSRSSGSSDTFDAAKPLAKYVVPAQTVCNYWNYWFTFTCRTASPTATRPGSRSARSLTLFPQLGDRRRPGRRLLGCAGERALGEVARRACSSRTRSRSCSAHPYSPTGQHDADCQGGQSGYASARAWCRASRRATRPSAPPTSQGAGARRRCSTTTPTSASCTTRGSTRVSRRPGSGMGR